MKKYLPLLVLSTFIFFSCASKNTTEDSALEQKNIAPEVEQLQEPQQETENIQAETLIENEEEKSTNLETIEENAENEPENQYDEFDEVEDVNEIIVLSDENDFIHQELEEIIEPEVITLEPEDIPETDEILPVIEEPIQDELIIEDFSEETNINEDVKSDISPIENLNTQEEITVITENNEEITNDDVLSNNDVITNDDEVILVDGDDSSTETIEEQNLEITEQLINIEPSRSVTLKKNEYLDITYPGSGWIYMGITDNSKDITYFGRKVGTENTKFSVQARIAGTKILHFYKNDPVTNTFIDDYLEVIILDEKGSSKTRISAPSYKTPVKIVYEPTLPEENSKVSQNEQIKNDVNTKQNEQNNISDNNEEKIEQAKIIEKQTVNSTDTTFDTTVLKGEKSSDSEPIKANEQSKNEVKDNSNIDSETLLEEAKKLFNEKNYRQAYEKISMFLEYSTEKIDEGLYIKAQILETKSDLQNISEAINIYTTLTKNYPASKFWDNANKRIIYLKRFYLEGR